MIYCDRNICIYYDKSEGFDKHPLKQGRGEWVVYITIDIYIIYNSEIEGNNRNDAWKLHTICVCVIPGYACLQLE